MQTEKLEFVPLIGLVLSLLKTEYRKNTDNKGLALNNVANTLNNLFLKKFYAFYRVTTALHNTEDRRTSNLPNAFFIIIKFIQDVSSKPRTISVHYRNALIELDTLLALPVKGNNDTLQSIRITPNHKLYDEFEKILRTFNLNIMDDNQQLNFFLISLFRRWGNPKIYKKYVLKMDEFKDATFEKSQLSELDYFIILNRNIGDCEAVEQELTSKEIKKLKAELLEKDQKIKELELIQTTGGKSKLGNTRAENNVAKLILTLSTQANIDVSKPYAQYESLKTQAELLGIDKFPSDENVASWLKKANAQNPN